MTETPSNLADTPAADAALTAMLRSVRLTGSVFLSGQFNAPFGIISPRRWEASVSSAPMRHVSVFHLCAEGECELEMKSGARHHVAQGDLMLVPFADEHKFWSGDVKDFAYGPDIVTPGPIEGCSVARYGGDGPPLRLVCGFIESAEIVTAPVFRSLPELLIEHTKSDQVIGSLAHTAASILQQVEAGPTPGAPLLLGRLMETLFIETLRRHAARQPAGSTGWLAALNDPVVARTLGAIHEAPAKRWTIDDLAQQAGASRTVLNERFNAMLGKPPIEYLAGWRIQLAADRLRASQDSLARVAEHVGYESEASFSRAFKRIMGVSPGAWREQPVI
jgi:AraC-like DNA-binding protein